MSEYQDLARDLYLEKAMYAAWLRESGETNSAQLAHLKNCVTQAITEALTDKQRVYLSHYMSGFNMVEIGQMCGVDTSTVSRTINRALDRLISRIKYATPTTLTCGNKVKKRLTLLYQY